MLVLLGVGANSEGSLLATSSASSLRKGCKGAGAVLCLRSTAKGTMLSSKEAGECGDKGLSSSAASLS